MTTPTENKEIVQRFTEEFIKEGNYDTAEEFLAEDVADYTPLGETTGRDAVVEIPRHYGLHSPTSSLPRRRSSQKVTLSPFG